ncbi:16S rRNA pseudouridine(516) synthase RsuA [Thorsellia anophelis]|uniref:Pseudouridine synthase n=1 Tax=Thorsellia anophelis DSM 18579 TaxID=1123402 RepID=A0A1H9ZN81_9GAMM|nr:16S rRNA pseudouridine(516) synthase RsuA [Thorsellia anophelis]SES83214.1 16S rRNA pseudouridine516 synthase [Thorsellia anophelis DSM 18579]
MERVDKILAQTLSVSRAEIQRLIRAKRITINGSHIKSSSHKISFDDAVCLDDSLIKLLCNTRYFMLNKPVGLVCANNDSSYPSVTSLLDEPSAYSLHAAGRLDVDTTGLVLLTDDGQWSHRITSPKKLCSKVYIAEVKAPLDESLVAIFKAGIMLNQEKFPTAPADLEILTPYTAKLTIYEGKYHQVKRMFAAVNNRVINLQRIKIGNLALDESLGLGEYRMLTQDEIALFN